MSNKIETFAGGDDTVELAGFYRSKDWRAHWAVLDNRLPPKLSNLRPTPTFPTR